MNLYQQEHSVFEEHFVVERKKNFSFPLHLHRSCEFLYILDGQMEVRIDDEMKVMKKNDCAFIFPHQIHSLQSEKSEHILFIFSPEHVKHFWKHIENKKASTNFFRVEDEAFVNMLLILDKQNNIFKIKGALYLICGYYMEQCAFTEKGKKETEFSIHNRLLHTLVNYAEENYKTDCSLIEISKHISYDYTYISKYFQRKTGISFNTFVNQLRVNEACFMLSETTNSILDIALECGYDNVRSFNRNFQKLKSCTPTDYRKNLNKD